MKALTVAQPWASLIVAGVKMIETRPSPPNGSMCPTGVRGLPGYAVDVGERIAIHAAATRPRIEWVRPGDDLPPWVDELHERVDRPDHWAWAENVDDYTAPCSYRWVGPLGAVIGTVAVTAALPITGRYRDDVAHLCPTVDGRLLARFPTPASLPDRCAEYDITDQLPLGDFRSGRWAWMLAGPQPIDPVPVRGRQGVWRWTR